MKPSILSMGATVTLLAVSGCVAPPFAFSAYEESYRIETTSGAYVVGQSPKNADVWGATFDNTLKSYPDPIEMKRTGVEAIEKASGCRVLPNSVEVQQTGFASIWAQVSCS